MVVDRCYYIKIAQVGKNTSVTGKFYILVMFLLILFCGLSFCSGVQNAKVQRETSGNSFLWIIAKQLARLEDKVQDIQKQYNSKDKEIETIKKILQGKKLDGRFSRIVDKLIMNKCT